VINSKIIRYMKIYFLIVFFIFLPNSMEASEGDLNMLDSVPFTILAIGQSNMEGRYGSDLDDELVEGDVFAWNSYSQKFEFATLGVPPFGGNAGGFGGKANNLALRFGIRVHENTGRPVRILLFAVGGKRIEYFLPTDVLVENELTYEDNKPHRRFGGSLGDEIFGEQNEISIALSAIEHKHVDVVLVHQGEANVVVGDSTESLINKYSIFVEELFNMSYTQKSTPIIFGEINSRYPNAQNQRDAIRELSLKHPSVSFVRWDGIDEVGEIEGRSGYNSHASGLGLQQLGDRYFEVFRKLTHR